LPGGANAYRAYITRRPDKAKPPSNKLPGGADAYQAYITRRPDKAKPPSGKVARELRLQDNK